MSSRNSTCPRCKAPITKHHRSRPAAKWTITNRLHHPNELFFSLDRCHSRKFPVPELKLQGLPWYVVSPPSQMNPWIRTRLPLSTVAIRPTINATVSIDRIAADSADWALIWYCASYDFSQTHSVLHYCSPNFPQGLNSLNVKQASSRST